MFAIVDDGIMFIKYFSVVLLAVLVFKFFDQPSMEQTAIAHNLKNSDDDDNWNI